MKKETLNHIITIRMDDEMYNRICNGARNACLSQVEYVRQMLTKGKVVVKQEIIAEVQELKRLIAELGKIGSNLNQIAHHYNSGGSRSREMYERTQCAIAEMYAMKFEVEGMAGDFWKTSAKTLRRLREEKKRSKEA